MSGLGLTFLRRGGQAHPTAGSDYILSANKGDAEVFRILMEKGVSSDGIGITKDDAAKVTSVDTWFRNSAIQSFDEFQYFSKITVLRDHAFRDCGSLKSIVLPDTISVVYAYVFYGCGSLQKVNVPKSLTSIGAYAFSGVPAPMVVDMPNYSTALPRGAFSSSGVIDVVSLGKCTSLYDEAFRNCYSLRNVILPSSLTSMQANVFNGCTSMEKVLCEAVTPPSIGRYNFDSSCPIYVPDASVDAYKAATNWSSYASRIKPLSEYQG